MIRTSMLALVIALSAGAARADDLSDLVDRYVAWRGGSAFEQLQTIHESGAVEASGLHGKVEIWSNRADQRIDIDLGVFKQTQVVTPQLEQSWDTNPSGQVETMPSAGADTQRQRLALEFADAFRGHGGVKATLLGVEQRDGASWSVVRLSFGGADTYDAFIDPATGALDGFRVTEDRQTRFERLGDWRLVDGVRMPFEDKVTTGAPGGDQSTRVEAVELNHPFPDARLARPGDAHKATFSNGASSTGWIPFEFFGGTRIFIPAKVNGRDVVVLLDSGAQSSVIDKGLAQSIGLKPKGEGNLQGSGGDETAAIVDGVTVEVGALKLSNLTVISIDLQSHAGALGHALPFVLGDELFRELAVDIDFANRRIAFSDPARIARPQGAVEVPLAALLGLRSIPVSVDGAPPVQVEFDLGSNSPLMVFPSYAKAHGLPDGRTSQRFSGGAGGMHSETIASLGKVELAGVTFANVPTLFPPDTISSVKSDLISGNAGLPVLSRFHLVIDYSHDRVWMTPEPHANAPFAKDRMGLLMLPKDGVFEVGFVSPGSPADKAGLKAGDRIRLVNHKPTSAWPHDVLTRLSEEAAGTRVELTMADGKVRRLTLKDYF
jgi:Aspartyl protease/PDZ domain